VSAGNSIGTTPQNSVEKKLAKEIDKGTKEKKVHCGESSFKGAFAEKGKMEKSCDSGNQKGMLRRYL